MDNIQFVILALAIGIVIGWLISEYGQDRQLMQAEAKVKRQGRTIVRLNDELARLQQEDKDAFILAVAELGATEL